MARKIKAKLSYNKNKKAPKAFVGAALQAGLGAAKMITGGIQKKRAKKAMANFDKGRLEDQVSSATMKTADQPMDQNYIEQMQGQQAADRASAMGALSKDPRNALAGVQALESSAAKQRTDLMGMQQDAKTKAMDNLGKAQDRVKANSMAVAGSELEGIKGEMSAGQQNMFGGAEDIASSAASIFKKGGSIEAEEGGVTPGEFSHKDNPIDMVQDGEKIGEATGGELILPPDDVEAVRSALDEGDKDAAFKLMEDLVAKYDKNVIESEEAEGEEPQQEPAPMMKHGGYLEKVKARMGAYMKSKY